MTPLHVIALRRVFPLVLMLPLLVSGCGPSHAQLRKEQLASGAVPEGAAPLAKAQEPARPLPASPAGPSGPESGAPPSLFERLGGLPAIEAVVADFQQNVFADTRINAPFAVSDLMLLRKRLVEFVCFATGGPCIGTGRDMRAAHKGMAVTSAQFDALVVALVKTLDKFKVPAQEKNELLSALGPLREQIVELD
jgi:hemoglobin